ncbi:MAG: hypothetical protein IPM61_04425 [Chlorobi bacterium]|nr:hypothetical protein [Chlorobiota bacterium]
MKRIILYTIALIAIHITALQAQDPIANYDDHFVKTTQDSLDKFIKSTVGLSKDLYISIVVDSNIINSALEYLNALPYQDSKEPSFNEKRKSIIDRAKNFIQFNRKINFHWGQTNGRVSYTHIYFLLYQWKEIYADLKTYVIPEINIDELYAMRLLSIDNGIKYISESRLLKDRDANKAVDMIIKLLEDISKKPNQISAPDYGPTFSSINNHLSKISSTMDSTRDLTSTMGQNIHAIKEELINRKPTDLTVYVGLNAAFSENNSKVITEAIGVGEVVMNTGMFIGGIGLDTQVLPRFFLGWHLDSAKCWSFLGQLSGVRDTLVSTSSTVLGGRFGCTIKDIGTIEAGAQIHTSTGSLRFLLGIKKGIASAQF